MHTSVRSFVVVFLWAGSFTQAQSPNANANVNATANADKAWTDLVALSSVTTSAKIRQGSDKVREDTKGKIVAQAAQAAQVSLAARAFYTQYPSHPEAAHARKLEAVTIVRGIKPGDPAQERTAIQVTAAFRDDRKMSANDRCDVALAIDRYQLSQQIKSKATPNTPAEWIKLGEKAQKDFGDVPALPAYYLEIARKADYTAAGGIAALVTRSPAASAEMRAEAANIVARAALLGTTLALKLSKVDGGEIDLAQPPNKVTALIVWSPANFASLADFNTVAHNVPGDTQLIYMALGGSADQLNRARAALPLAGAYCYAPTVAAGRSFAEAVKLKHAAVPYVYVLNRAGKVAGFGRLNELPGLIAKAVR